MSYKSAFINFKTMNNLSLFSLGSEIKQEGVNLPIYHLIQDLLQSPCADKCETGGKGGFRRNYLAQREGTAKKSEDLQPLLALLQEYPLLLAIKYSVTLRKVSPRHF